MIEIVDRTNPSTTRRRTSIFDTETLVVKEVAEYLYGLSTRLGPGLYAELGCFYGGTAMCIAQGIRDSNVDASLITVDCFDGYTLNPKYAGTFSIDSVRATFEKHDLADLITAVKGFTAKTAALYKDKLFNFVFIDADHSYSGCKADFDAWSPLVRPGGEIAFHDTNLKGVSRVLAEIPWKKKVIDKLTICTKPGEYSMPKELTIELNKVRQKDHRREYSLFQYLSSQFNGSVFLEFGTLYGQSANALAANPSNLVITYDVVPNLYVPLLPNVILRLGHLNKVNLEWIDKVDLIYVDVAHAAKEEQEFLDRIDAKFKGILIMDAINDKKRWDWLYYTFRNIPREKYLLPKEISGSRGTGLVVYGDWKVKVTRDGVEVPCRLS